MEGGYQMEMEKDTNLWYRRRQWRNKVGGGERPESQEMFCYIFFTNGKKQEGGKVVTLPKLDFEVEGHLAWMKGVRKMPKDLGIRARRRNNSEKNDSIEGEGEIPFRRKKRVSEHQR